MVVRAVAVVPGLLALAVSGCALQVEYLEVGPRLDLGAFQEIEVGSADRAEVLERMGPPLEVRYTLEHEELLYRSARHSATDIQVIIPTEQIPGLSILGRIRGALGALFPAYDEPLEFEKGPAVTVTRDVLESLIGFGGAPGSADLLSLHGRRIAYDRLRFVLDRDTLKVLKKSYEPADEADLLRDAFLQD